MATFKKRVTAGGQTRWDARVRIGAKVVNRTHRTKELAETWARATEDAVRSGEVIDPSLARTTVAAYGESWLAGRRLGPRTRAVYLDLLERRINPDLGKIQLRHLTPDLVRRWYVRQPEGPYTAKGYRLLRSICATAMDDGILRRQPCRIEHGGRESSPERPLVTPDELAVLVDHADDRAKALILLAGWCGLRRGELLALERRHIDELHRTVRVEQSVQWLKGKGRVVLPPKSEAGRRTVDMPGFVAAAVATHMADFVEPRNDAPVAVGISKRPASPRTLHRWWTDARSASGLDHVRFHDLRHAAGTMAAWTGATTKELQDHLGHATPAAAHRYQHTAKERSREMADALDALARGDLNRPTPLRARDGRAMGQDASEAQAGR